MMWIAIFITGIVLVILGIFFLAGRIGKFTFVNKISKGKKWLKYLISFLIVFIVCIVLTIITDLINMAICMVYLMLIWILCELCHLVIKKITHNKSKFYLTGMLAILCTFIYMAYGCYNAYHVSETRYSVKTDKNVGNIRIAHISDSHVGTTFDGEGFAKHLEMIQDTEPDVLLITGDFVDDYTSLDDMVKSSEALGRIETKYGIYFSFGNHDKGYYDESYRGYSGDDLIAELEKNGVTVLQDENVLIDDRFYIVGRQDYSEEAFGGKRASMEELVSDLDKDKYIIVMDHQPHDYKRQAESGVDIVLSGHTHGGQFFPVNNLGVWIGANDKTYGTEKRGNTNFFVTSGISDWLLKFKTGCKSEYVIIDVEEK